jgi:hypothetical protein
MNKINIMFLSLLLLFAPITVQSANNASSAWQGTYSFGGVFGRDNGGITITYDVVLKIKANGTCKVEENGYQIMTKIDCIISKHNDGIDIIAQKCSKDDIGLCGYERGDRLFSLFTKSKRKNLITVWGKLKPEGYVKTNRGVYLKRDVSKKSNNS